MTQKSGRQQRYAQRYPERHAARLAVFAKTKLGLMPRGKDLPCTDCGGPAREYDHYLGYDRAHWFDVEAVCRRCHLEREKPRKTHCHRGHEYTDADWLTTPEGFRRRACLGCERYRGHTLSVPFSRGTPAASATRRRSSPRIRSARFVRRMSRSESSDHGTELVPARFTASARGRPGSTSYDAAI
jgi:hypothetical protein